MLPYTALNGRDGRDSSIEDGLAADVAGVEDELDAASASKISGRTRPWVSETRPSNIRII